MCRRFQTKEGKKITGSDKRGRWAFLQTTMKMKNRKFTCKKCSRISTKSLLSTEDKKISPAATELCDFFLLCKTTGIVMQPLKKMTKRRVCLLKIAESIKKKINCSLNLHDSL